MNTRILKLIQDNLLKSFGLEKYTGLYFTPDTKIESLPWTSVKFKNFTNIVNDELKVEMCKTGTISEVVDDLDKKYLNNYFGKVWKPTTDKFIYSGWALVDEINVQDPKAVLDVGCGYNQFKTHIKNLVGVDPYNNCADYMVDILDFEMPEQTYDHMMVLGSLNFNERVDLEIRLAHMVKLLDIGGKMYFRVNPGRSWEDGPYVDIHPWDFKLVSDFAKQFNNKL